MPLPVGYAYYRAHCVPGDTEVLTRDGWVRLDCWDGGDIAQVHPDQCIEFLPGTRFIGPVETDWLRVRAPYLKCDFTLGHTMPYFTQKSRNWVTEKAGALAARNTFDVPTSGMLIGDGALTPEQMRVLVMVQADGSFTTDTSIGRRMCVYVKKPRKIDRARQLLSAAGVVFCEQIYPSCADMVRFIVKHKDYPEWMTPERKMFGSWLLDSTLEARVAFLAELEHWDGFRDHAGCVHYSSSVRMNAEWAVTMAHLCSKSASIHTAPAKGNRHENYTVAFRERAFTKIKKEDKYIVTTPQATYCASTQTGFWLARTGDRIFITGNTGRFGGTNKMNFQNLPRGGELRLSILAPKGHMIAVVDSGQIEARVNAWLWGQTDLLDAFRAADAGTGRDAYCNFADHIYGRTITKADAVERQVGKVAVLGLGYQMGPAKFQTTLAKMAKVYFDLDRCKQIVTTYREVNDRIANGWRFCDRIINDMFAGRAGHHGPLAWEKETIFLPNGMRLKYPDLKKTMGDNDYPEWTYQSKDSRKKMYGGLLCLGASTQVLTDRGWLSIIEVRLHDKLWDGINWVDHSGLVFQGVKETIDFGGVDMTPDHEVLVDGDWHAAQDTTYNEATSSFTRHHRTPDGYDDCNETIGQRRKKDSLVHSLRLRADKNTARLRVLEGQHKELRVLDWEVSIRRTYDPRDVTAPSISCLAGHVGSVQVTDTSVVGEIWRTWHNSVRTLEKVRRVLGGHGRDLPEGSGPGSDRQHAGVQPRKLQMDRPKNKRPQHQGRSSNRYAPRHDALVGSSRGIRGWEDNADIPQRRRMASTPDVRQTRPNEQAVFDLVDAGPLKRFTVRGVDGKPFLVHNCENIIQALARIIVMWQMLQVDKKYRVVMTTHDEFACVVKKVQAEKCLEFMTQWMKTPPDWCPDLPLNSEGKVDVNYSK